MNVSAIFAWSEHLGILGYSDNEGAVCLCPSMYCPGMVRVSWDLGILWQGGAVCLCPSMYCPGMVRVSRDLGILWQGGAVCLCPSIRRRFWILDPIGISTCQFHIESFSWSGDGQTCKFFTSYNQWKMEYYFDWCIACYSRALDKTTHGQSILGSRDTLTGGAVCMHPSMYCPGMVRVSRDLGMGCSVHVPIHVLSWDGQSILGRKM